LDRLEKKGVGGQWPIRAAAHDHFRARLAVGLACTCFGHGPLLFVCGLTRNVSCSSRPCPGRNLGLGRETGHPPGPNLVWPFLAIDLDIGRSKPGTAAPLETLGHSSPPLRFSCATSSLRRKEPRRWDECTIEKRMTVPLMHHSPTHARSPSCTRHRRAAPRWHPSLAACPREEEPHDICTSF
jgi:hypothetical protein